MKRLFLLFLLLCCTAAVVQSQETRTNILPPRPKVGVVLGGGGAKGAAHIGVLKYIEEMGIPVDYVAGTSMGSILGGLYAMGYTPDQLTQLIANMNWSQYIGNQIDRPMMSEEARKRNSTLLLAVPFSHDNLVDNDPNSKFISQLPSAYVNNSSLINLFNDLSVGYQEEMDFNDLPIPFACVATDMITGNEVVMRSGSVPTAMRASMAIPGVFSPVKMGDMVLVDGGLVNNFPADVLREMGADIIIGIEITSTKDITAEDLQSLPQVFSRLVTNSTNGKREENRKLCNLYIVPDVSGFGMLSFTPQAIDTLVERGYKKACEYHDQFVRVKMAIENVVGHSVGKELHAPQAKNIAVDTVKVRSITINNVPDAQSRWLLRKGRLKPEQLYTQSDIEKAMQIYRGTGCFDEITYQVKESDSLHKDRLLEGYYDLVVDMKPTKPHLFGLGLRYDTEEGAALLFNLGLNAKKFNGSKLNLGIKLSYNPKINLTYTYSKSSLANFNLAYEFRNQHFRVLSLEGRSVNLHYHQQRISGYISQFHLLNLSTSAGLSYISTTYDPTTIEGNTFRDSVVFVQYGLLTPFINVAYDNLDDAYFAKHGIVSHFSTHYYYDSSIHDIFASGSNFDICYDFQAYITPHNGKLTLIPQVYGRYVYLSNSYYNLFNLVGGQTPGVYFENQMPFIGKNTIETVSNNASILRFDLRYNFFGKHYLTAMYNAAMYWNRNLFINHLFFKNIYQGVGLKYSYKSFLGPISLTAHWSDLIVPRFGLYFSVGYTF